MRVNYFQRSVQSEASKHRDADDEAMNAPEEGRELPENDQITDEATEDLGPPERVWAEPQAKPPQTQRAVRRGEVPFTIATATTAESRCAE